MLNVSEINSILDTRNAVIRNPDHVISELSFDSRKIILPSRTLFFAIKTERNDGHYYIDELIRKGVVNFVITEPAESFLHYGDANFFVVDDAVNALQRLARSHRSNFEIPVIGITGSNGKTIVKEWLSQLLSEENYVVKNPNSYNSQIGVPLSVWQMQPKHDLGIFEAGISQVGEMEKLEKIIRPALGILTNIGDAHGLFFESNEQKLIEKLKLFSRSDALIYRNDDSLIREVLQRPDYKHIKKISWGERPDAHYRIEKLDREGAATRVFINGNSFVVPFVDSASMENMIHIIVTLLYLGFSPGEVATRIRGLVPVNMRMEILDAWNRSVIINDTYSLDFHSLRIALDFLSLQSRSLKKTLIISDFEQVGVLEDSDYRQMNALLKEKQLSKIVAVGEKLYLHRDCFDIPESYFFHSTEEMLRNLDHIHRDPEAILIKGARNYHFEKVVEKLRLKTHRTILNIHLPAIINNLNYYRSRLSPDTKVMAMVKAMCYGLGDAELINELVYHNVDYLAVAYTDEGVSLRKRNIRTPIVVLGAEAHSFEMMIQYGLEPEIFNLHYLRQLSSMLNRHPEIETFRIHIKLDTGMHRLGFDEEDMNGIVEILEENPKLKVASVFSHLAASEDKNEDNFTLIQIEKFRNISDKFIDSLGYPVIRHILNSAGILRFPEAQFDMVRLGLGLYGISSVEEAKPFLQNAITLKTLITQIKKIKKGESLGYNRSFVTEGEKEVAIIPIGYADGLPRALSNGKGSVYVKNRLMPILGKISMDMTIIDVTGLGAEIGDEVIVYGDNVPVDEVAKSLDTIPYELLTSISKRVPRIYIME